MHTGSAIAILGTTVACLVPFASQHHHELGLSRPLLSKAILSQMFFVYRAPDFELVSHPRSVIGHMFTHAGSQHLVGNLFSLISSGFTVDVGFWRTLILIYGGGIAGVAAHILEQVLSRRPSYATSKHLEMVTKALSDLGIVQTDSASWLWNAISSRNRRQTTFVLCGLSSGVFALIGAEVYKTCIELRCAYFELRDSKQGTWWYHKCRKQLLIVFYDLCLRSFALIPQILAVVSPRPSYPLTEIITDGTAYSAHLGGFLFGFCCMKICGWR